MAIVKFLGFLDFIAAVLIILGQTHVVGWNILLPCAAYLILKGIIFFKDIASKIDLIIGIYCLFIPFHPQIFLTILAAAYLIVKSLFSLFS